MKIAFVVVPLLTGITLYWLFRGIPFLQINQLFTVYSHSLYPVAYNVPDGLWLYALLQALRLLWGSGLYVQGFAWLSASILGAIASECAQLFHVIPGTFDLLDIAAYISAVLIFILQYPILRHSLNPQTI